MKPLTGLVCALLAAILGGCASSPKPMYFTLDKGVHGENRASQAPRIVIARVSLPDLLDRPQMVFRSAEQQVRISEFTRWAEPLRSQIPLVLADAIGHQLGSSQVVYLPVDAQRFDADYRLSLDVLRFEMRDTGSVVADILWRLEPRQGEALSGRSTLQETVQGKDAAAFVASLSRSLQGVASDIVARIRMSSAPAR